MANVLRVVQNKPRPELHPQRQLERESLRRACDHFRADCDIEAAISWHGLTFDHVITREDVCSYKPRPELFLAGLETLGLEPAGKSLPNGSNPTFTTPTLGALTPDRMSH